MTALVQRLIALVRERRGLAVVDQALISGGNFLSGFVIARGADTESFGLYVLAYVAIWFAVAVQNGLLLQPFVVQGAALEEGAFRRFLAANVPLQVGYLVLSGLVLAGVALVWEPLRPLALPIAVAGGLLQAQEFCRRVLYTRGHVGAALLNNVVNYDLQVPVLAVLAVVGQLDVARALWVSAGTSLLAVGVGIGQLGRFGGVERDALGPTLRSLFAIGRWSAVSYTLAYMTVGAYPALVSAISGLAAAAGLGVIRQILGPIHLVLRPLENVYLPRAAEAVRREGSAGINRVLLSSLKVLSPGYLFVVLAVILFPGPILDVVYGHRYTEHAGALRVFAVVDLLIFPVQMLALEINARRMQRFVFAGELWMGIVIFTVGIYLIQAYGLDGAGVAMILATFGQLVLYLVVVWHLRQEERLPPSDSLPGPAVDALPLTPQDREPEPVGRPLVSVMVPAYNDEPYLEAALESALAQTYSCLEILVLDDGSTDGTLAVAQRVAKRDPRVRVLHNETNVGVAAVRNRALAEARGEWITYLDGDDVWLPRRVEALLAAADATGADVVSDDVYRVELDGQTCWSSLRDHWYPSLRLTHPTWLTACLFLHHHLGVLQPLVRRAFLDRTGLRYDSRLTVYEDFLFELRLLIAGARWLQLSEGYYLYYRRPCSLTSGSSFTRWSTAVFDAFGVLFDEPAVRATPGLAEHLSAFLDQTHVTLLVDELRETWRYHQWRSLLRLAGEHPRETAQAVRQVARRVRVWLTRDSYRLADLTRQGGGGSDPTPPCVLPLEPAR